MSLTNTATVTGNEHDPNTTNNTASVSPTATREADLQITKTDSPDPVYVGENITYTLVVTNNGPSKATGVTVTDTLPSGVTFVSATSTQGGTPTESTGVVTAEIGQLDSGSSATVTIIITPTTDGEITNTASVVGNETDPNPNNNTATATTTVNKKADLSVTKTASPNPVVEGTNITFTIEVTNNGPSAASGVVMTDTLPSGVTFVSASSTQGGTPTESGGVVTANIGSLANGAFATVTIVATVNNSV